MTIKAITKEIEKRIEYLEEKYEEAYHDMISCKVRGDSVGEDKAIENRRTIHAECSKLKDMLYAYDKHF